jgi:uroporphyrinogen decarboxylase
LYSGNPIKEIAYGDPLIKTKQDALKLKPADPYKHGRMPAILKAIELANKKLNGAYPVGGVCDNPVHLGGCLMGWTQMFMAMEDDPELWKIVEDVLITTCYEFAKAQIKAGAVFLVSHTELPHKVGSDKFINNPIWIHADHPPELYNRIWKEFEVDTTLHACTSGPFMAGIDVWKTYLDHTHSFFVPEHGGADALFKAKEMLAPAVIMGNLHPLDIMLHGTPSEVEEACVELIKKCGPGGRFILGPGCSLSLDVSYENMKMMTDSVRKYGEYPINNKI